MQPKLNLFIDLQRRMLNGTGGRTSNLLLKGSRVFCPATRSSPTTTLLFQLGSPVTHRVLKKEEHSFIAILMALRDQSPMFPRFCPNPSGITVRSRKRLWRLCLLSRSFSSVCLVKNFILVTDHKPLLAIYGNKKSSGMVANRLACWALYLNQFDFQIENRKTADHQNADALSRLPLGEDKLFDE